MNLKNEAIKIRMRLAEFKPMESVEDIHSLVMQALSIEAFDEVGSGVCENPRKAYSL